MSSSSNVPSGINLPGYIRPFRTTRALQAAWSPHNVLATISGDAVHLTFGTNDNQRDHTICSDSDEDEENQNYFDSVAVGTTHHLGLLHEIKDRSICGDGAVPIDTRWHPRLTPHCFPAQAALAILYTDGFVTIHYVSLESSVKLVVERVCTLEPGKLFSYVSSSMTTTITSNNNSNNNKIPITFALEWIGGNCGSNRADFWPRFALFSAGKVQFVRIVTASDTRMHSTELIHSINENPSFRPISSSMIVLPQRFPNNSQQSQQQQQQQSGRNKKNAAVCDNNLANVETVLAVLCGATNVVKFYFELVHPPHFDQENNKSIPHPEKIIALQEVSLSRHLPAASSITLAKYSSSTASSCDSTIPFTNFFTLCVVGPGITVGFTFAASKSTNKNVSTMNHIANNSESFSFDLVLTEDGSVAVEEQTEQTEEQQKQANFSAPLPLVKLIGIHCQSTPPYTALDNATIPLELTNIICIGEQQKDGHGDDQKHKFLRFLAFSFHEVVQIDIPILSSLQLSDRTRGIQADIFSPSSIAADSAKVTLICSSASETLIEKGEVRFYKLIYGICVHPSGDYCAVILRGNWTRIMANAQTWLFVGCIDNYVDKGKQRKKVNDKNASMAQHAVRADYLQEFVDNLQQSIFSCRRKNIVSAILNKSNTVLPEAVRETKEILLSNNDNNNTNWTNFGSLLLGGKYGTGLAATMEKKTHQIQQMMFEHAAQVVEMCIQREFYNDGGDNNSNNKSRRHRQDDEAEVESESKNDKKSGSLLTSLSIASSSKPLFGNTTLNVLTFRKYFTAVESILNSNNNNNNNNQISDIAQLFQGNSSHRSLLISALYFDLNNNYNCNFAETANDDHGSSIHHKNEFRNRLLHELILPNCCRALQHDWKKPATVIRAYKWLQLYCDKYKDKNSVKCQKLLQHAESVLSRSHLTVDFITKQFKPEETRDRCPICKQAYSIDVNLNLFEGTPCLASRQNNNNNNNNNNDNNISNRHRVMVSPTSFRAVVLFSTDVLEQDASAPNFVATRCVVCGCGEQLDENHQRALCLVCGGLLFS